MGGDTLKSITIAGSKTDAGLYENEIVPSGAAFNYNHTVSDENVQNYSITYNAATLTISKATTNSATVTLEGWTYGDTPNTPVTTATFGADTATYTYSTTVDGEYTATVPTAPGTYYVKATIAGTDNYVGATATASFTIAKTAQSAPTGLGKTDETIIGKNDGTITGLTEGMEYSADGETWTAITEEMLTEGALTGLAPGTYQVRYAETDTASASEAVELVIGASTVAREYDDEWTWTETETGYTATVVLTAKDDPTVVLEPEDVVVTSVTTEPTATDPGKIVYTATVTVNGVEYTDEKVVVLPATGVTVSGTVISFLGSDESDEAKVVTLTLTIGNADEAAYTTTVNETNGTYTFTGVAAGTYTLAVSKMYHVTRTYQLAVAEDGTVTITEDGVVATEVKIHLIGDVTGDGKVSQLDVTRINVYVEEVGDLTSYEFACADINNSGTVTHNDVMRLNLHIEEEDLLW